MAETFLEILVAELNQRLPRHWAGGHLMDGDHLEETMASIDRRWDEWYTALNAVTENISHNQPINGNAIRYLESLIGNAAEAGQKVEIRFTDRRGELEGSGRRMGNAIFVVVEDCEMVKITVCPI